MHVLRLYRQVVVGSSRLATSIVQATTALLAVVIVIGAIPGVAIAQQAATMTLDGQTSVGVDQTFTVQIRIKTSVSVNAVQADINFPSNLLAYQSVSSEGSAFSADLITSAGNGNVSLVRAKIGGGTGDMLVATMTFKGLKDGRAEIRILDTSMATDSQTSENVVSVRQGLTVVVGSATPSDPIETGTVPDQNGGTPDPSDPQNPDITPTIDPELDSVTPTPTKTSSVSGGTILGGGDGGGLSTAAWSLIVMSILLVAASIFFSVNLLRRRSRRMANYQNYMQPPVNPMYNQGQLYDLSSAGYTSRQYQQNPYQRPVQQRSPAYQNPYTQAYMPSQQYQQAPGQTPPVQQTYQQPATPQQPNQYHW